MTRLTYTSHKTLLRALQISPAKLIVFIEGRDDTPFYDHICSPECQSSAVKFEIRRARELPDSTGGKQGLLLWYEYLRKRGKLLNEFKNKKTAMIFFCDKDLDDLKKTKKHSRYVVYTEHYDFEGYLFRHGNMIKALAAVAETSEERVTSWLGTGQQWRRLAAERWKEWVKLCCFASVKSLEGVVNYAIHSPINDPPYSATDSNKLKLSMTEMEIRSGLGQTQFKRAFQRLARRVDEAYAIDHPERVFKAKWYCWIAEREVLHLSAGYDINGNGLGKKLSSALLLTLDFEQPWTDHFKVPLRALLADVA